MELNRKEFDMSLAQFGFTANDINAINLRLQKHILPQLEAIQVQALVSPKNGDLENAITELIKYLTDDFLWAFKLDSDWLDEYRIIKRLLERIETEKNILQR